MTGERMTRGGGYSVGRRLWLAAFLVAGSFVVALLVAELVLRARAGPARIPFHNVLYPYVMFRAPADVVWRSPGPSPSSRTGEVAVETTNADGFRTPAAGYAVPRSRPGGQTRIAVVGGSTVRVGTSFDTSLPGALRRALRKRFPEQDIEVINAGIISAVSSQELVELVTELVDFDLDLLVVYDGINDSGQMLYFEDRPDFPYFFGALENAWTAYLEDRSAPAWQLLLGRSALARSLWPERFGSLERSSVVPPERLIDDVELRRRYARAHQANWAKMHRIADAYGIAAYFVLQPTSLYGLFPDGRQTDAQSPALYANYLVYEDLRTNAAELARTEGIRYLDLAGLLPVDSFYDGAHVYDEVNDRIAGEIEAFIGPELGARFR
jgi:hypothetical protein